VSKWHASVPISSAIGSQAAVGCWRRGFQRLFIGRVFGVKEGVVSRRRIEIEKQLAAPCGWFNATYNNVHCGNIVVYTRFKGADLFCLDCSI